MKTEATVLYPNDEGVVTLCSGSGCCPTLRRKDDTTFIITDDNGNSVTLTDKELLLLQCADLSSLIRL